jgi:hypothetical protein
LADFTSIHWLKSSDFTQVDLRDRGLFSKSYFAQSLLLGSSTIEKAAAFRNSRFDELIDFQDIKLLEQVDFSNAIFNSQALLNVDGLAFDSDKAKILGDRGVIGAVIYLPKLSGNETIIRNLVRNFRNLEQIPDANQIDYTKNRLKLQQINELILSSNLSIDAGLTKINYAFQWLFLSLVLLLSDYGTNFSIVLGVGIITTAYFGLIFWFIDRFRRIYPRPILPNRHDAFWMFSSYFFLTLIGSINVFQFSRQPKITLACLALLLFPITLFLMFLMYQKGRYHDLMDESYFVSDGSLRQLRLLIVRLPVIPEFPFFRDRYTPLIWERRWNWLNYYDFSLNNLLKVGFNDIRLRDRHLPGIITTLVWYQWGLGMLYIALLLWTLSRTIPGLNLLIYLK